MTDSTARTSVVPRPTLTPVRRVALICVCLLALTVPTSAQDFWTLTLAPTPGGHVETVQELPDIASFELNPLGLGHVYTWYWIEWFVSSTTSCSSASSANCTFRLPSALTRIDVPVEDPNGILGTLVTHPRFEPSTRVTFTAVPDPGYYFHGWTSPACGPSLTCQPEFPIDADLQPIFSQCPPGGSCITVQATPTSIGTVVLRQGTTPVSPIIYTCDSLCTFQVPAGSNWTLTSLSAKGAVLSDWTGCDAIGASNSCALQVTGEKRVVARFKYPLTVTNNSQFVTLYVDVAGKYLGVCEAANSPCTFLLEAGASVGLTRKTNAPALASYTFSQAWQGCVPTLIGADTAATTGLCALTMDGPRSAGSIYADLWYVSFARPQHGRILSSPAGIDCGTSSVACAAWFPVNSTPTFAATSDPGYTLFGWNDGRVGFPGGECVGAGNSPTCSVLLNHQPTLSGASFYPQLNVQIVGGGGILPTVFSASPYDNGTTCPATAPNLCLAVAPGSTVSLDKVSIPGFTFSGWSGACSGTGACSPTINAPTTVTATYAGTHKLLLTTGAFGIVGITSTPFRTRCNYGCDTSEPGFSGSSVEYSSGTTVNLVAVAGTVSAYPNYVFAGWSGICSGKSPYCTILMGSETVDSDGFSRANANFVYGALTSVRVDGQGRVTSDIPSVDCTSSCGQYTAVGSLTTLTATPSPGWVFAGWSGGGCSGTGDCVPAVHYDPPFGAGNPQIVATFVPANAGLSDLKLSRGTLEPTFSSSVQNYAANVGYGAPTLTVTPTAIDGASTIQARVNGGPYQAVISGSASAPLPLLVGPNTVDIRVTASDAVTTKAYTVIVTRAAFGPGDVDPTFNPNANNAPYGMAVQPDGKAVLGGNFSVMGGVTRIGLARLNADGTPDASFNPLSNNGSQVIAVQADGKIVVGGFFTLIGGVPRNRIARLNADGTLDTTFDPNANGGVRGLQFQPDGKLIVAGQFTTIGGVTRERLARLLPDGTVDASFTPSTDGDIYAMALQADGKVLVAGTFLHANGANRIYLARFNPDGTLDTAFAPTVDSSVYALAVQADGKLLIGGFFNTINGTTRRKIARLNDDGSLDSAFDLDLTYEVETMALQADGGVILAGAFLSAGGVPRNNVVLVKADGSVDPDFDPDVAGTVRSLALQADGKVLIGGDFLTVGDVSHPRFTRLVNTPATQTLTVTSANRIEWLRGGSSPEALYVTFELTTDGANYSMLGSGVRIPGGWEITGLSLPATGQIRARARVSSGNQNGSSGLVEATTLIPGTPTPAPEIAVSGNGADIAAGNTTPSALTGTDFGNVDTETGAVVRAFTVTNSGNAPLALSAVTLSGPGAADFSLSIAPTASVMPTASTTFKIRFDPSMPGVRSARVNIANNDDDESPFSFAVQGTGTTSVCPAITLPSIGGGVLGRAYSMPVTASGGVGPYTYAASGMLPDGLTLSGDRITGTPTVLGTFNFDVTATDTAGGGACTGTRSYSVLVGSPVAPGDLVINEFRLRGPAGTRDEYIEIANRSNSDLTISATDGSAGFGVMSEASGLLAIIPNGTVIPFGGYFLAANSTPITGYSLSDYGGANAAQPDAGWTVDVPETSGIGLFNSSAVVNAGTVLDAVGFAGTSSSPFIEGTGLSGPYPTGSAEVAYFREQAGSSTQDTGINATDFFLGDTTAATYGPVKARLAAPGPKGLTSPRNNGLVFSLADPSKTATTFPNRFRTSGATPTTGTYYFRWKITNTSTVAIHTLRLRVARSTTLNSPGYVPGGSQADFRLVASADAAAFTVPVDGSVIARGLTLEPPPTGLPLDGGNNASAVVALPGGVLAPGASVYVNLAFRYAQAGGYAYFVTGEGKP